MYRVRSFFTCNEFRIVNIQANTMVSWLTASKPNTHVIPSKGDSITVAFRSDLCTYTNNINIIVNIIAYVIKPL